MKKLYRFFASPVLAILLLSTFAVAMAVATFVENDFGTATAWKVIYDSWWFEMVMLGLGLCFTANIYKYKLWRKEKWSTLLFHLAFIVILLGAAITRYTSEGGVMRIREGGISNTIISDRNYLTAQISDGKNEKTIRENLNFSPISNNDFELKTAFENHSIELTFEKFVADAIPLIVEDEEDGKPIIELVISAGNGRESIFLEKGEIEILSQQGQKIGFEAGGKDCINIIEEDGELRVHSPIDLNFFVMANQAAGLIVKDSLQPLPLRTLYRFGDISFVPNAFYQHGLIVLSSGAEKPKDNDSTKDDALVLNVSVGEKTEEITLLYREGFLPTQHEVNIDNIAVNLSYGSEPILTPFALRLNDFQMEKYPGSTSPSSYASQVTIIDDGKEVPFRIFMNNVLDHKGFRFYQASYDTDEKGTVLSVNRDRPGTLVTYLGYLLMGLGMFWTLFGRASRFRLINKKLKKLKEARLAASLLFLFSITALSNSEKAIPLSPGEVAMQTTDAAHAELFGRLMIQDLDGRIKPINSLASEFLRKLTRKPYFKYTQHGEEIRLDADQAFLAMHISPAAWERIPLIKVDQKKGGELLADLELSEQGLASFVSLLNAEGDYLLTEAVEEANLKKPGERSELDKEVIKIDERFNILYNVFIGNFLKIFPNKLDENNTWFGPTHHFENFTEEDANFAKSILPLYFQDIKNQDWAAATEKLSYIKTYQEVLAEDIIPGAKRVEAELWYNQLNLNFWLFQAFFTLGSILLILSLVRIFKNSRPIRFFWNASILLTLIGFLIFTGNILLRWYVAQHAPWSNGYEMLVFVAWVLLLCGLLTFRKSDFALPLATLFSGTLLLVSYLDWLNPEITNLMPVLKSVWLKVHVATIVSSYAPLALSAVLGLMALVLMIIKSKKTQAEIDLRIQELTYINEISMTIGLFVLAVGTFLGGVWANESWGRYWAWDPKETWSLISIIVYAIVLHLRFIPGLQNKYALNTASLFAFWSIIMTSFGVNYYLSGLHSYAAGDPVPVPTFVYVVAVLMVLIAVAAYFRNKYAKKLENNKNII